MNIGSRCPSPSVKSFPTGFSSSSFERRCLAARWQLMSCHCVYRTKLTIDRLLLWRVNVCFESIPHLAEDRSDHFGMKGKMGMNTSLFAHTPAPLELTEWNSAMHRLFSDRCTDRCRPETVSNVHIRRIAKTSVQSQSRNGVSHSPSSRTIDSCLEGSLLYSHWLPAVSQPSTLLPLHRCNTNV